MKRVLLIISVIFAMSSFAITPDIIIKFLNFDNIEFVLTTLAKQESVYSPTVDEIKSLTAGWKKRNCRIKAIDLLKQKNIDIFSGKNALIIEWGGGGISYRAFFLSERAFFVQGFGDGVFQMREIDTNSDILGNANAIKVIAQKDGENGNISWLGDDFQTYIITTLGESEKTLILYEAAVFYIKNKSPKNENEKNSLKIYDLILKLQKSCEIKPATGA